MKTISAFLTALIISGAAYAQKAISVVTDKSKVEITGTSSLHDWEEIAKEFTVAGTITDQSISKLVVKVKAKSIESDKSVMTNKTHEALKADKFPWITLSADQLAIADGKVKGSGTLEIAGKQNKVAIESKVDAKTATQLTVSGAFKLKMTDYGMEPPTAMFGTMVTGDEVTIHYTFVLNY